MGNQKCTRYDKTTSTIRTSKSCTTWAMRKSCRGAWDAFPNFAISFSIICILSGGINSLGQATSGVGGAAIGIGWPVGVLMSGVFALALAQIASAYPTAGGLYHWGSILGNRFTGWLSAWLNLLGLITVLGAINVGTFYFFFGAFGPAVRPRRYADPPRRCSSPSSRHCRRWSITSASA